MDDVSFYQSRDGYLLRMKGGVDGSRIKTDPAFARTRENGNEFGQAGKRGKLLRSALRNLINRAKDSRVSSRLHQVLMKVIQSDTVNSRGQRDIIEGDISLLKGFDFNAAGKLGGTVYFPYTVSLDRVAGEAKVSIPSFVATEEVAAPAGATHLKLIAGASEVSPQNESFVTDLQEGGWLPLDTSVQATTDLTMAIPTNTAEQVYVVFGVEFGQEVNGSIYVLKNGAYNALGIVEASKV